jgi:hypothetical protein
MAANAERITPMTTTPKDIAFEAMRKALEIYIENECDYMKINHLGDPEKQFTVKTARRALALADKAMEEKT